MKKSRLMLYRFAAAYMPRPAWLRGIKAETDPEFAAILKKHRTAGARVVVFNDKKALTSVCYGIAAIRDGKPVPVTDDTMFRVASVSKLVTAMAAWRLYEAGRIDIDADVDPYLPVSLRHPAAADKKVTLRRLMSHTAGIHDSADYDAACTAVPPLSELMTKNVFSAKPDGFEYSNLGAGIVACVLEGMLNKSFEAIMQEALFAPLHITASFYPQTLSAPLADSFRVMKRTAIPALDSAKRQARPLPDGAPDPEHHYLLSQGNLYITASGLAAIGTELMKDRYAPMRGTVISFGARDKDLSEGIGTFIVRPGTVCDGPVYGHQGLAYGAMHGLFYDPVSKRGCVLMTSGCSEAREGVLSDINKAVMRKVFMHG